MMIVYFLTKSLTKKRSIVLFSHFSVIDISTPRLRVIGRCSLCAVEAYMQMLGHYMGPGSAQEFSRHSVHSVNFYHSQWQRHQMELFQPFHATRSNTISVLSDFSNHSSDKYSTTSGSSSDDSQLALLSWKPLRLTVGRVSTLSFLHVFILIVLIMISSTTMHRIASYNTSAQRLASYNTSAQRLASYNTSEVSLI